MKYLILLSLLLSCSKRPDIDGVSNKATIKTEQFDIPVNYTIRGGVGIKITRYGNEIVISVDTTKNYEDSKNLPDN